MLKNSWIAMQTCAVLSLLLAVFSLFLIITGQARGVDLSLYRWHLTALMALFFLIHAKTQRLAFREDYVRSDKLTAVFGWTKSTTDPNF